MSTSRGRNRSSCSGGRLRCFIGGPKLQGFCWDHTKPCRPVREKPPYFSMKSIGWQLFSANYRRWWYSETCRFQPQACVGIRAVQIICGCHHNGRSILRCTVGASCISGSFGNLPEITPALTTFYKNCEPAMLVGLMFALQIWGREKLPRDRE